MNGFNVTEIEYKDNKNKIEKIKTPKADEKLANCMIQITEFPNIIKELDKCNNEIEAS